MTSGKQAYLLGLMEQGMETISKNAKGVDEKLSNIEYIKKTVDEIHAILSMRQDSNLGEIVIKLYQKISLSLCQDKRKALDRAIINCILSFDDA